MSGLTLDARALIAFERNDRNLLALSSSSTLVAAFRYPRRTTSLVQRDGLWLGRRRGNAPCVRFRAHFDTGFVAWRKRLIARKLGASSGSHSSSSSETTSGCSR